MMNTIDQVNIKAIKARTLSHLSNDRTFQRITEGLHIAYYKVNGSHCMGVTFEELDNSRLEELKFFCDNIHLEHSTIDIPWKNRKILFIRPIKDWKHSILKTINHDSLWQDHIRQITGRG